MNVTDPGVLYDFDFTEEDDARSADALSAADALIRCVNRYARVDLEYMSSLSGKSVSELISLLAGKAIFQNPALFADGGEWNETEGWLLASQYLCGNIPEKLRLARTVNARLCCFDKNILALEKIAPERIDSSAIRFSLGATWIPEDLYEKFIAALLEIGRKHISVVFNRELSVYQVEPDDRELLRHSVLNNYTYGTPDFPALKIIEHTMNAKSVKVYDYVYRRGGKGGDRKDPVLNRQKTLAAQEKQALILSRFEEWTHENKKRTEQLCDLYNERFVGFTHAVFDGSFLSFDDLNPAITLYPHQKNTVARVLLSEGNLLLAHAVGTGKTYEMIVSCHELYRVGLSKKNMIVVPNAILRATADRHALLYPRDRILVVTPKDFAPAHRNAVLEEIRDGDYVAVYLPYSSFDMITVSKRYRIREQQERIDVLRRAAACAGHKKESAALLSEAERLAGKLSEYATGASEPGWLPFDELGVETLFLDEAHNYKNINLQSRSDFITGLQTAGSAKCVEMYEKCRCPSIKKLVFATATPLTNSIADLYAFQRYLQPEELKFRGIDTLDTWANTFAERETDYEVDVDARHQRLAVRFSRFNNIPELLGMFSTVCDFYSEQETQGLPAFRGYRNVIVPRSEWQELYIDNLSDRADAVHAHQVSRKEDNLLKITICGRLAALDIRLADKDLYEERSAGKTKTDYCAEKVAELYRRYPDTCQLVFSDVGTPKDAFNVYDELKRHLIWRGIPAERIAFIHDASTDEERLRLFSDINRGRVSVCIGSTQKLGTGVNVQESLIACHHLDVPWRPADMIQREGRILRQGNRCKEVFIYHYITEKSFDAFSWQILEKKARFLASFLSGVATDRDTEEIDRTVLRYAEIKALAVSNPLIKKRVETANRLNRAKLAFRTRQRELLDLRELVDKTPAAAANLKRLISVAEKDMALYAAHKQPVPAEERQAFGEELISALIGHRNAPKERLFDTYQHFDVCLPAGMRPDKPFVRIRSAHGGMYDVEIDPAKPLGCSKRIDYLLEHLPDKRDLFRARLAETLKRAEDAEKNIAVGNPHKRAADDLTAQLRQLDEEIEQKQKAEEEERKKNHVA